MSDPSDYDLLVRTIRGKPLKPPLRDKIPTAVEIEHLKQIQRKRATHPETRQFLEVSEKSDA
ncbi:MAG TPA: hypothetical protein VFO46_02285 [Candidatus Sulfotelmatobacter sp.]|nr:hypothetical protein [Candidatus Sulfotelmatobacter sp.]